MNQINLISYTTPFMQGEACIIRYRLIKNPNFHAIFQWLNNSKKHFKLQYVI